MKILNVSHAILLLLVFIGYQLFMINGAIASIPRFSDTQDGERPDKMPDHVWNTPASYLIPSNPVVSSRAKCPASTASFTTFKAF